MRSSTYQAPADIVDAVVAAAVCRSSVLVVGGQPGASYRLVREFCSASPMFGADSPVRASHHTISVLALRAEIEIARGGILVINDVAEFSDECLDMLFAEHGASGDFAVIAHTAHPIDGSDRNRVLNVSEWFAHVVGMNDDDVMEWRSKGAINDIVRAGIGLFQAGRDAERNFSEAYPPSIYMRALLRVTRL